jgi:hypothetical protein
LFALFGNNEVGEALNRSASVGAITELVWRHNFLNIYFPDFPEWPSKRCGRILTKCLILSFVLKTELFYWQAPDNDDSHYVLRAPRIAGALAHCYSQLRETSTLQEEK